ncbi:unnamed protein product [Schistosoma margrebowiei]|uniref:Saposin B-type domain-containing protein n=1 Tax=Schistosoma margrebowiei TaxID=48269 RepID=A0AA84ZDR3_9TREM|nr:unnamed protein product [Schistosoma margrebowiei]
MTMKTIFILSLAVCFFAVQTECNSGPAMNNLFLEAAQTFGSLKTCATKTNGMVEEYFKEDGLGQKMNEVVHILLQRLNKRIKRICS